MSKLSEIDKIGFKRIYSLNPNYSDFVILETSICSRKCTFLIDTQADISIIKIGTLNFHVTYDTSEIIRITGITDDPICSLGVVATELISDNFEVTHPLHVVPNSFHIPSDGILGKDFLKRFNCEISYRDKLLTLWLNGQPISIPIIEGPEEDTIVLPARSEVVRRFTLRRSTEARLAINQEIGKGIFVARTVIHSNEPLIRILNTTDQVKIIKRNRLQTEKLSDYYVYTLDKVQDTVERTAKLMEIIKQNTPEYVQTKLLPLCTEFSDIFAMETDAMTINNFYTQKLRLTDHNPVYIKNYRLPHSQKTEVHSQVENLLKNDFIEPSASNFNSPIILVPKSSLNGQKRWRLCLDYRQVNKKNNCGQVSITAHRRNIR